MRRCVPQAGCEQSQQKRSSQGQKSWPRRLNELTILLGRDRRPPLLSEAAIRQGIMAMGKSNFVGCTTGKSPGLAPFQNPCDVDAGLGSTHRTELLRLIFDRMW